MTLTLKPLAQILRACSDQHDEAVASIQRENRGRGFIRSRGRHINLRDAEGRAVDGTEGEGRPWNGTLKDLKAAIEHAEREGHVLGEVLISCGYNWSETFDGFDNGDYDAWCEEWEIRADAHEPAPAAA